MVLFYAGRCIGRLPPTFDMIMNEHTHAFYAAFKPEKGNSIGKNARGGGIKASSSKSGHGLKSRVGSHKSQSRSELPQRPKSMANRSTSSSSSKTPQRQPPTQRQPPASTSSSAPKTEQKPPAKTNKRGDDEED